MVAVEKGGRMGEWANANLQRIKATNFSIPPSSCPLVRLWRLGLTDNPMKNIFKQHPNSKCLKPTHTLFFLPLHKSRTQSLTVQHQQVHAQRDKLDKCHRKVTRGSLLDLLLHLPFLMKTPEKSGSGPN